MTLLALLACAPDQKFSNLKEEDVFQQQRINTVDVLLVVDNSCSMIEEQGKLSTNFPNFIQYFEDAEVDWHIGVVTTDSPRCRRRRSARPRASRCRGSCCRRPRPRCPRWCGR